MHLTVSELARAVNKSETYVRQHIRRRHLAAQRDAGKVSVAPNEASRWARARGLPFVLPAHVTVSVEGVESRTARMTVLTWHPKVGGAFNLFTLIRHRRQDSLGPWASKPCEIWSSKVIPVSDASNLDEFRLHSLDAPLGHCQELVDHILAVSTLEINGQEILYSLSPLPRRHRAYRNLSTGLDHSVSSPFTNHSAELIEYWSFDAEPRKRWLEALEKAPTYIEARIAGLCFPLGMRPDRVGNLMISGAEDAIDCELLAFPNEMLLFKVDGSNLVLDEYTAAVWATHSGDNVLRRELSVMRNETAIELQSDVDHIGFAVYRNADGQCIDLMEVNLWMEFSIAMHNVSGPTLQLRERRGSLVTKTSPWNSRYMLNIDPDKNSIAQDAEIRRQVLERKIREREATARKEDNLARFSPDQFNEATEYFLNLLRQYTYSTDPIYLADPYFIFPTPETRDKKLYLDIFSTTKGRPLRILCGQHCGQGLWWSSYPSILASHVTVRGFSTQKDRPAFHDRFLIHTRKRDIHLPLFQRLEHRGSYFCQFSFRRVPRRGGETLVVVHRGN